MADLISYASAKCKHFNNSLDESGKLTIAGFSEYPSKILFEMDIEAYKEAMNEFYDTELEDLKIEVFNNFPSCIA
ncbi:MAG: hypothetical protein HY965_00085, partial [Ignavibacteriales bacterium]|nr:hypothetical protein [Ignavibacteriales bacterium]